MLRTARVSFHFLYACVLTPDQDREKRRDARRYQVYCVGFCAANGYMCPAWNWGFLCPKADLRYSCQLRSLTIGPCTSAHVKFLR